ncbi:TolC family protein [Archangium sp.]|jgi:outer membrane protein TolC|uniref:TolC family protein n=1 Tax=Archangium sp. TaxID=1872627 RepID=UPI002ED989B2
MPSPSVLLLVLATAAKLSDPTAALPSPAPFQPHVEDAMLTPVPPAQRQVESWDEALALVRERSTDLRTAEANVQRAEGRWRQSLATLLPNVRASVGTGLDVLNPESPILVLGTGATGVAQGRQQDGTGPTVPLVTGAVSLSQSLVDFGAWRGLSSARASETSAVANLQDVRRRLTLGLARVLVATVAAERVAEINRVGLHQALERAALTQRTFELGASTQLDVVRVNQDVAQARGALVSGDEQLRRARETLGLSLGFDHALGVRPAFNLQGLVEMTRKVCAPLGNVSERPDLVAARSQVEAARDSRRQASAGYLPTLGLSSSLYGFTTEPGPGRLATWNIVAVLSVPLWEGGLRGGLVSERQGLEQQAAESLERTRRDVLVEVERARRSVEVAEGLVKTAAEARALAERSDQLTRRSFEVGRGSSLELVQSGAILRQAELTLALREFELVQARLDAFLTEARCDW